jgi:hypothetical protein
MAAYGGEKYKRIIATISSMKAPSSACKSVSKRRHGGIGVGVAARARWRAPASYHRHHVSINKRHGSGMAASRRNGSVQIAIIQNVIWRKRAASGKRSMA